MTSQPTARPRRNRRIRLFASVLGWFASRRILKTVAKMLLRKVPLLESELRRLMASDELPARMKFSDLSPGGAEIYLALKDAVSDRSVERV